MTLYELVDMLESNKRGEAAWDGWDEVPGELLDAASVKAIMLDAMGVIPHDIIG